VSGALSSDAPRAAPPRSPAGAAAAARARALAVTLAAALLAAALLAAAATPGAASAQTQARVSALLRPDRPGALAALTVAIRYEDPQAEVPAPLRRALLRLPYGLGMEVPRLRACSPTALRRRGPSACPAPSRLGGGFAIAETHAGSQTLSERVRLSAFLGPLAGLQPTFELFAEGLTPFRERVVLAGQVAVDAPPYGEDLAISVPPVATLPLEPDASIAALSLTIGVRPGARSRGANAVLVPSRCPPGGLPFAVLSSFADGTVATASTLVPCPRQTTESR
jgi:hypothetical protein